jgi:VWFA-related protein
MKKPTLMFLGSFLLLLTSVPGAAQELKRKDDASVPVSSQEQKKKQDIITLKSVLVEVQAVVTDRQGRLVDGLKKEDFELREKGHPQAISSFSEQRIGPMSISQAVTVANVPNLEAPPSQTAESTRSVLLFVDTLHLSPGNVLRVKQTVKKFIDEQITDQDSVMLVTSSGMEGIPPRLTRDRNLLRHFVDKIAVWGTPSNSLFTPALAAGVRRDDQAAMDVAKQIIKAEGFGDDMMALADSILRQMAIGRAGEVLSIASYKRISLLDTLRAAAELMARAQGQRVMFFFSDGFSLFDSRGNVESQDLQLAISSAVRAGVVVYSISTKGLEAPPEIDASRRGLSAAAFDPTIMGKLSSYASASEKEAQDGMNALARDTGGTAFFRTNDMNHALEKSFEGNRIFYEFAYYPSNDGEGFRDISLKVKGHPEYSVRTQKGYLASDAVKKVKMTMTRSPQQRLFAAIARPMSESAINVSAFANYLEAGTDSAQVSIQVQIDGSHLTYHDQADRSSIALEVAVSVFDRAGRPVQRTIEQIAGKVPIDRLDDVKKSGFNYCKRMELKPGYYQVRVGVLDPETENMGTASSWVEVPDLSKGKLALSSILLTTVGDALKPTYGSQELNAIKAYKVGSVLVYYVVVYNAGSALESDLMLHSELVLNEKVIYESDPQPASSRVMGKDKKGIEIGGQLKLNLDPGFYELRVALKDKSNHEFHRTVEFLVAR